ncbi:MAG: hypothetical protein VKJ06_08695 [Vampirovibrionales bacterium]|nr:hypothetical protein [Vampirovibrionales bacterium]
MSQFFNHNVFRKLFALSLGATLIFSSQVVGPEPSFAAGKKNAKAAEAAANDPAVELAKLDKIFDSILVKVRARMLLSPKDASAMAAAKLKLMDLMTTAPTNAALVLPVYKAGLLYAERDFADDALELFEFLQTQFPNHPYSARATKYIVKLGGTPIVPASPSGPGTTAPAATGASSATGASGASGASSVPAPGAAEKSAPAGN